MFDDPNTNVSLSAGRAMSEVLKREAAINEKARKEARRAAKAAELKEEMATASLREATLKEAQSDAKIKVFEAKEHDLEKTLDEARTAKFDLAVNKAKDDF